jgi:hypothetical protein
VPVQELAVQSIVPAANSNIIVYSAKPGGNITEIQYNNGAGLFGATRNLTWSGDGLNVTGVIRQYSPVETYIEWYKNRTDTAPKFALGVNMGPPLRQDAFEIYRGFDPIMALMANGNVKFLGNTQGQGNVYAANAGVTIGTDLRFVNDKKSGNLAAGYNGIYFADGTYQYTAAGSKITVQDEGSNIVPNATTINFVGSGVTASNVGGVATVTVSSGLSGIAVQEEGSNVVDSANTINFVGSSVTASNVSGVATITVSSSSGIAVQEEGSNVVATANTVNFVGAGVTASNVGGVATVTIPGGGSGITVQEEGSNIANAASIVNFVGAGVTASNVGGVATITVPLVVPGGSNTQVQFNDNSSFGGNSKFTFDKTTGNVDVTAGNISVTTGNFTGTTNGVTLGYRYMPQTVLPIGNSNVTLDATYTGGHIVKWATGELQIYAPGDSIFPVGAKIEIFNSSTGGNANVWAGANAVIVGPRSGSPGLTVVTLGSGQQVSIVNMGVAPSGSLGAGSTVWFCYGFAYPFV